MLRLPKRYARDDDEAPKTADAGLLLAQQNLARGLAMSLAVAALAVALWVWACMLFDRYFPWGSVLQGVLIGLGMRRYGRGIDWRFPLAAAGVAAVAAALGSFLIALFLTGREFGTGALELIGEVSMHTLSTFFRREFGVVGVIYMASGAVLASFYANRRLERHEAVALRRLQNG